MNWISHLNTMTIMLVSADAASLFISAAFFSERVRRWTYRRRWGSHPAPSSHLYSVVLADMDDPSGNSIRLQPSSILRNPFDAKTREALGAGTAPLEHRNHSHRPTFRRSTALQQRIAAYERALASFALISPEPRKEARSATPPISEGLLSPSFGSFGMGYFQEAQPS